jgi:hypothetical protein
MHLKLSVDLWILQIRVALDNGLTVVEKSSYFRVRHRHQPLYVTAYLVDVGQDE